MTYADLVFAGGTVHTVDAVRGRATAVAVRDGRVVTVGHDVDDLIGPDTEVVDLRGGALIPGFQDAHVHPAFAGVTMLTCNLMDVAGPAEALARVAAYAAAHPEREWITGSGWSMDWFPGGTPERGLLDAVVADRPIYLTNRDGHGAWVNTRAFTVAGIDAVTPDPADGRIEREPDGSPAGTLHEGAALLVGRHVPHPTEGERLAGLLRAQEHLHALGITAWQDAIVGPYLGYQDPYGTYLAAARAGRLTARVTGALWWDRDRGLDQLPELRARRENSRAGRFRPTSVKIMQDGVVENFTAAMIDPYLDGCGRRTGNRGRSHIDPAALREYVTALDAHGFQVHLHAIGDRAVREALDAIAAARDRNGTGASFRGDDPPVPLVAHAPADNRHHIAHLQVVHPDDIPRFAALDVAANMQPLWAAHDPQMDELTIPFLGPQQAARQYPFAALRAAGAVLAAGSDWAVSSANPWWGIHVAVNRIAPPGEGTPGAGPLLPGQALDLGTALAAYTMGSAYVNHLDHETGSIEAGKLADLAVLDRDPFAGSPEDIHATQVTQTYVAGRRVFPQ